MDLATVEAFMADRSIQRYLSRIDDDTQAALDEHADNLRALSMLSGRSLSQYRNDAAALRRAQDGFNTEWERVRRAQARDGRAASTAYSRYVLTLGVLELDNARFGCHVQARTFTLWAALARVHMRRVKRVHQMLRRDIAFLRNLHTELRRARREVTEAEAQRVLNAALNTVAVLLPAMTLGVGIGVAAGIFAVQTAADAALGPSGPTMSGAAVNATSGISGLPGAMSRPHARMMGAAGGVISWVQDCDEVALAESNVATIRDMMRRFQRESPRLMREVNAAARDVNLARQLYEGAVRQARAQARSFREVDGQRRGLIRELARLS